MTGGKPKFLFDAGVGKLAELRLAAAGYDVKSVREIDPFMTDLEILRLARIEQRIVITIDKDFGEYVFHARRDHFGVILLRMEDATGERKADVLTRIVMEHEEHLLNNFSVYQRGRVRIRGV